ncbi:MAG: hypothetical protein OQK22_16210 [Colwellia sp.]|nr:hypothetical protein [Colwellia sp.]
MKLLFVVIAFLVGFGASSYLSSRYQLEDEINDYQREVLISSRLLEEYTENCSSNRQSNFSPYVEHSTLMYERLIRKSQKFPYYMGDDFINDHEESVFNFQHKIELLNNKIDLCK